MICVKAPVSSGTNICPSNELTCMYAELMSKVSGTRGRRKDSEVRLQTPTHTLSRAVMVGEQEMFESDKVCRKQSHRWKVAVKIDEKRWKPCKWPREQRESWQRRGSFFGELDSAQSRSETFSQLAIALCLMKLYEEAENSASLTHCWLNYHFLSYCDQEWNHCFVHIKWNIAIFTVAQNRK